MWLFWLILIRFLPAQQTPERRAIDYLSREVPAWSADNHCFSCHNNGDAARALYIARRLALSVADSALNDTTEWLKRPQSWDQSEGKPGFSDKKLSRIEFANSLLEAFDAGLIADRAILQDAVRPLVASQDASGAWMIDKESAVASPATYGPVLATYMARRALERAEDPALKETIDRAGEFLQQVRPTSIINASALVMAFGESRDATRTEKVNQALELIARAQSRDGGWGPYPNTPTEIFDSALALLALAAVRDRPGIADRIQRGRSYLIQNQLDEGGWIETTRPAGGRSYAEHISTTGWATIALLRTR